MACTAPPRFELPRFCRAAASFLLVLSGLAGGERAAAQELAFPADHHPWAGFPVGSWKLVRTVTENLDEQGNVSNVTATDTKTTLVGADDATYSIRTETTIETAGRRLATPPQTTRHGLYGEAPGQMIEVERAGEAQLTIDGRSIACELRRVSTENEGVKRTSTLHYSNQVAPYVLRRETTLAGEGSEVQRTTLVEVVALDLPQRVQGELEQAMHVKTTQSEPTARRVTLEVQVEDVPGWVVAHWASERDEAGRLVRRSTLELREFGFPVEVEADKQPGAPPRARRLQRKAARRMTESR
jgi:hypothetical protein